MEEIVLKRTAPSFILYHITENLKAFKDYTYLIMGKSGPTGKTWLADALRDHGYNAVDISEGIYRFVSYCTETNQFLVDHGNKLVIITLNENLKKARCQTCGLRKYYAKAFDIHWLNDEDCLCLCPYEK